MDRGATMTPSTPVENSPEPAGLSSRKVAIPLLALLGIELVLGIVLDAFVNLPSGASVVAVLSTQWALDFHIVVAVLLIGLSGHAVISAGREPTRRPRLAAVLALLSALVASAGGWEFVFNGQNPAFAGVMTLGFVGVLIGAVLLRVWGSRGTSPGELPRAAA